MDDPAAAVADLLEETIAADSVSWSFGQWRSNNFLAGRFGSFSRWG
jgi:hypothetical protein